MLKWGLSGPLIRSVVVFSDIIFTLREHGPTHFAGQTSPPSYPSYSSFSAGNNKKNGFPATCKCRTVKTRSTRPVLRGLFRGPAGGSLTLISSGQTSSVSVHVAPHHGRMWARVSVRRARSCIESNTTFRIHLRGGDSLLFVCKVICPAAHARRRLCAGDIRCLHSYSNRQPICLRILIPPACAGTERNSNSVARTSCPR